jgi:hypothetical protein
MPVFQFNMFKRLLLCLVITELINKIFIFITVDTTSMMISVCIENHYMFLPHWSSSGGTLTRNFVIEYHYFLAALLKCGSSFPWV